MRFKEKLAGAARKNQSWLCVGLDPELDKLPSNISRDIEGIESFLKSIIDSTADIVCAYKPNSAFFEQFGIEGSSLLKNIIAYIPDNIPVILDAKRGDIGNSSRMYAVSAFEYFKADAITANPYMGYDCLKPFFDYKDHGVFILCLTSNPSSSDFQKRIINSDKFTTITLYEFIAEKAVSWNNNDNVGLVVGATSPVELSGIREIAGDNIPILIPGVGAQGGDLETAFDMGGNKAKEMAIINVSRSVIYASAESEYAEKARAKAMELVAKLRARMNA
jgi:orotidine-5'-phosphate decarboxylase